MLKVYRNNLAHLHAILIEFSIMIHMIPNFNTALSIFLNIVNGPPMFTDQRHVPKLTGILTLENALDFLSKFKYSHFGTD